MVAGGLRVAVEPVADWRVPGAHHEVLRRKLSPPVLPARLLPRSRLVELGSDLLSDRSVLAVFACAGSGKSVAVRQLAQSLDLPIAWLNFDERDADASRALRYLTAALDGKERRKPPAADEFRLGHINEEAAFLAQRLPDQPRVIVLDNCEYIAEAPEAGDMVRSFVEHLPESCRVVLSGRRQLAGALHRLNFSGRVGWIGEHDLALTVDEMDAWVHLFDHDPDEVAELWTLSRGWIAPIALLRRGIQHDGGFHAVLNQYLADELLGPLTDNQRRLLLETSVLESVDLEAVRFMCSPEVSDEFGSVVNLPLPMSEVADELIYHPVFRSFLRDRLESDPLISREDRQRRHVGWLLASGQPSQAIDALLQIGDLDEAAVTLEAHVDSLMRFALWDDVLRFIESIGSARIQTRPLVMAAQIRSLRSVFRFEEARSLVRDLESDGRLQTVVDADPGVLPYAAGSMLWNPSHALGLLDRYEVGARAAGVRYMLRAMSDASPAEPPSELLWTGARSISWGLMVQGRLRDLVAMMPPQNEWPPSNPYTTPHPLLGLLWRGEVARTRELFDQVPPASRLRVRADLWLYFEALLLLAEDDPESALAAADKAVRHSRQAGVAGFRPAFQNVQARALLATGRIREATDILKEAIASSAESGLSVYVEWNRAVLGQAFLMSDNSGEALTLLRDAVEGMGRAARHLMLPMAAGFLAEAEWRAGNEDEADQAAALAYATSEAIGSFTALQIALREFPSVLHRQIDLNAHLGWRDIVTSSPLATHSTAPITKPDFLSVELRPFGPDADICINGSKMGIRRIKVLELAALITHKGTVRRDEVLTSMFPESDHRKAANYLRQLIFQMRQTTGLIVQRVKNSELTWQADTHVVSSDVLFENALREARTVSGQDRLDRLRAALRPISGCYLMASDLEWVAARRYRLALLEEEAVAEVAALAFKVGDYDTAREFSEAVLARNPYSQDAYRTLVHIETIVGTKTAVVALYRRAVEALGEIGLDVAPDTALLINRSTNH